MSSVVLGRYHAALEAQYDLVAAELDDAALPAVVAASELAAAAGASLHAVSVVTPRAHDEQPGAPDGWAQSAAMLRARARTPITQLSIFSRAILPW